MHNFKRFIGYYMPSMPAQIVYLMQQTDYSYAKLAHKLRVLPNLKLVKRRGQIIKTGKTKILLIVAYLIYILLVVIIGLLATNLHFGEALLVFILSPILVIALLSILAFFAGKVIEISRKSQTKQASDYFLANKAQRIAVMGSFGKTTMKELLLEVLGEHFKVAATPGNQNVPISIARWAHKLRGDEDILILEFGEGKPGDIAKLAKLTHPNLAVITGIAPNHLDAYKTMQALLADLGSITDYVSGKNILANKQAAKELTQYLSGEVAIYDDKRAGEWIISNQHVSIDGLSFTLCRDKVQLQVTSQLLGRHNIGPLAAVASLAMQLGIPKSKIENSLAKTMAYNHRMQPRLLQGAWLIDDTYNGNLEGVKAGLALLSELSAKRKIYVTPGLVEQGSATERVHTEIGQVIAQASPDITVLMQNSVTDYIVEALKQNNYQGTVKIEPDPLSFYKNIDQFIASGDIVLMQNDWPDGYR